VGSRAGLDTVVKRKIPSLYRDLNPTIIQPVAQRYVTELQTFIYVMQVYEKIKVEKDHIIIKYVTNIYLLNI
jgi:hypothetical protein